MNRSGSFDSRQCTRGSRASLRPQPQPMHLSLIDLCANHSHGPFTLLAQRLDRRLARKRHVAALQMQFVLITGVCTKHSGFVHSDTSPLSNSVIITGNSYAQKLGSVPRSVVLLSVVRVCETSHSRLQSEFFSSLLTGIVARPGRAGSYWGFQTTSVWWRSCWRAGRWLHLVSCCDTLVLRVDV